jgi:hypothetical protein
MGWSGCLRQITPLWLMMSPFTNCWIT